MMVRRGLYQKRRVGPKTGHLLKELREMIILTNLMMEMMINRNQEKNNKKLLQRIQKKRVKRGLKKKQVNPKHKTIMYQ